MARKTKFDSLLPGDPDLDVSSLIDVCFLLLIYFLATSTIIPKEEELSMTLPSSRVINPQHQVSALLIRVDGDGTVFTGSGSSERLMEPAASGRDLPQLSSQLSLYKTATQSARATPMVQLSVNNETSQQRVVDVLNVLAATGINQVAFTDLFSQP